MNGRSLGLTVGLLTAVMAVAVGCTWAFRAMRTVMDVRPIREEGFFPSLFCQLVAAAC